MTDIPVSIDLETLGVRADAVILSIGAAAEVDGTLVTFASAIKVGNGSQTERLIDSNTLAWWREKGPLFDQTMAACEDAPDLREVLLQFAAWYSRLGNDRDRLYPWGNGASFDVGMLDHAFAQEGIVPPWQFWTVRDLRTLKHLAQDAGVFQHVEREGVHHDAVTDAVNQLRMIQTWWTALVGRKEAA